MYSRAGGSKVEKISLVERNVKKSENRIKQNVSGNGINEGHTKPLILKKRKEKKKTAVTFQRQIRSQGSRVRYQLRWNESAKERAKKLPPLLRLFHTESGERISYKCGAQALMCTRIIWRAFKYTDCKVPHPEFLLQLVLGGTKVCIFNKFPDVVALQVHGPHFENHIAG